VKILDVGEWSLISEPVIELGHDERLVLRVQFIEGGASAQALFLLVFSPSEVDTRIDVVRREQTVEACQAELAETQARCAQISPARFARAGLLTKSGVVARTVPGCYTADLRVSRLSCSGATAYRADGWGLVDVEIHNESDQPWAPREAILKSDTALEVLLTVRAVEMDAAQLGPGEVRHVLVEVDPPAEGEMFTLELRDTPGGRSFKLPTVDLSETERKK
jgi:uncharacterized protein (TIGR02268 family)